MRGLKRIWIIMQAAQKEQLVKNILNNSEVFKSIDIFCGGNIKNEDMEGTVVITDVCDTKLSQEALKLPKLGYGLDYNGSAAYVVENAGAIDKMYLETVYCRYYNIPMTIMETERLIIREMSIDDLEGLYDVYDTLKECPYVEPLYERKKEEEYTREYIKNMYGFFGHGLWLLVRKEDSRIIGRAGIENREIDGELQKELGYLIGKPWQNKGYAKEAAEAILEFVKEQEISEYIFLCCNKKNIPSINLAQKLGFCIYAEDIDGMNLYYKSNA